jgi:triacylglycerol esterase/lipase EstA (alpha/beta hydrolase family)
MAILLAGIWEQDGGPGFVARHNLDAAQYQAAFDEFVGQGFRLTCVSGYTVNGSERFAAVWEADGGPAFAARHNLDARQYQAAFDELVGQGFRLTDVSGYVVNGQERFAAIWQADGGPSFVARHNLDAGQYQAAFDEFVGRGFRLTHVSGYVVNGQERFAAIWEADGGPSFVARHNLDAGQYQAAFDQFTSQGFRLKDVSGYVVNGQERFAAIWEADGGPSFAARHNVTSSEYQAAFDQFVGQGFRLRRVVGYESFAFHTLSHFTFANDISGENRNRLIDRHRFALSRAGACGNLNSSERDSLFSTYGRAIHHTTLNDPTANASAQVGGSQLNVNFGVLFPQGDVEIAQTLIHEMMHCAGFTHPVRRDAPAGQSCAAPNPAVFDCPNDNGVYYGTPPLRAEFCIAGNQSILGRLVAKAETESCVIDDDGLATITQPSIIPQRQATEDQPSRADRR